MSISKKIFDSMKELKNVSSLVIIAMLLAIRIVLGLFANATLPLFGSMIKISASFLPIAVAGGLFGAIPAAIIGAAGDLISFIISPTGIYFPGFTISGFITGFIYGLFFYKNNFSIQTVILAWLTNMVLVETFLSAYWLYLLAMLAGEQAPYSVFLTARLISVAIKCVPEILLILATGKITSRISNLTSRY